MKEEQKEKILLYTTCFSTGAVILILEILGFRILAPYFGYSIYVSGSLIVVILAALSLGYYFGGKQADKHPEKKWLSHLLIASTAYLTIIYFTYNIILNSLQEMGTPGAILSTTIIFAPPMLLLSMVSPYLIRLLAKQDNLGRESGKIFAISTIGSIAGSFSATFLLIPGIGSKKTLILCIAWLALMTIPYITEQGKKKKKALILLPLLILLIPPYQIPEEGLIYETESAYNTIKIYDQGDFFAMALNNPEWIQSYGSKTGELPHTYIAYMNFAPVLTEVETALILGMSGGESAIQLRSFYNNIKIDAVEIDPKVVETAKQYFKIEEDEKLKIHVEDAKTFVRKAKKNGKKYDFIEIDLYQGGPEIPFYLATQEFFQEVHDINSDNGIVMMNVIGNYHDKKTNKLSISVANTLNSVYPSVHVFSFKTNTILIATKQKTELDEIKKKLKNYGGPLKNLAEDMNNKLFPYKFNATRTVFTNDKAPVEQITHQISKYL